MKLQQPTATTGTGKVRVGNGGGRQVKLANSTTAAAPTASGQQPPSTIGTGKVRVGNGGGRRLPR